MIKRAGLSSCFLCDPGNYAAVGECCIYCFLPFDRLFDALIPDQGISIILYVVTCMFHVIVNFQNYLKLHCLSCLK